MIYSMTGLKRNLIYWGYMIEKYFFLVLFIIAITVVLLGIANGRDCFEELIICCPLIFNIMILSSAYSNITESMAQVISMGATRRESFIAMQVFFHLMVVQGSLLTVIVVLFIPDRYLTSKYHLLLVFLAFYMLSCGIGNAVNAVMMRFGLRAARVVFIIAQVIICLAMLGTTIVWQKMETPLPDFISIGVILAALVLDIIMVLFNRRAVMGYEVHA